MSAGWFIKVGRDKGYPLYTLERRTEGENNYNVISFRRGDSPSRADRTRNNQPPPITAFMHRSGTQVIDQEGVFLMIDALMKAVADAENDIPSDNQETE